MYSNNNLTNKINEAVDTLRHRRAAAVATPDDAIALAKGTETLLAEITDEHQRAEAATRIAAEMLNTLIFSINNRTRDRVRTLAGARSALAYIDLLPIERDFAESRYLPQRDAILKLAERYGAKDKSFGIDFRPTVGDNAYFNMCVTDDDLTAYIRRHPDGAHVAEARDRIGRMKRSRRRRRALGAMALRLVTAAAAVALTAVVCKVAGCGTDSVAGAALIASGLMLPFVVSKSFGTKLLKLSWIPALALVVGGVAMIHYEGKHRQRAELDTLLATRDEDGLMAYIANSGNTYYADEAMDAYLALMDSIFFDPTLMEKPSQMPPLTRMESFSRSTDISEKARARLQARVAERSDSLYRAASAAGTLEAWEKYQSLVPDAFSYDSQELIDSLDEVVWSAEASAWQRASHINTREAYERYTDEYPDGAHAEAAGQRLIDFEVKDYRNQGMMTVNSIDRICQFDGRGSKIGLYNDTEFQITMLLSGPTSASMVIPANDYAETLVADGTYQVLVRIANPRRDRFSFSQDFTNGIYSSTISLNEE